ncbi:MAG: GNAT family N-acetyltransferase [Rhodocyclales bacterium]|nr:GNAT family N-acetyltransferase [Rhodocyclales bacterium]
MKLPRPELTIRPFAQFDSPEELASLVRTAYAPIAALGLKVSGASLTHETLLKRLASGNCLVAECGGKLIGTLLIRPRFLTPQCAFLASEGLAYFYQFAVLPEFQRQGVGTLLQDAGERYARRLGYTMVAGDTPEPLEHLVRYYLRRGRQIVDYVTWNTQNFRSVVTAKALSDA